MFPTVNAISLSTFLTSCYVGFPDFCTAMIWYLRVMYLKSPRGFIVMSHDRDERGVREKIRRTSPRGNGEGKRWQQR